MSNDNLQAGNRLIRRCIGSRTREGKLLLQLWETAIREIHSRQIGGTEQGTEHCLDVENNIGILLSAKTNNLERKCLFILSAAAALHDIAKRDHDGLINHGRRGAKLILKEKIRQIFFGNDIGYAKAVSYVLSAHDDGLIDKGIPEGPYDLGSPPNVNLRCLAALFRLADMLDTNYLRVRYIVNMMGLPGDISDRSVSEARSAIRGWGFNQEDQTEFLIQIGKNVSTKCEKILHQYLESINRAITKSQKKYLVNFQNIFFNKKRGEQIEKFSFPYNFKLRE